MKKETVKNFIVSEVEAKAASSSLKEPRRKKPICEGDRDGEIFSPIITSKTIMVHTRKATSYILFDQLVELCIYVDQGAIASNGVNGSPRICNEVRICTPGTGIQGDFNLTNFEDGILSSAFLVGLLVASPIFASLARRLVGVGEASFISLAAPYIDDNAPVAKKTLWLGVFYMCVPSGYAIGYIYGGLVGQYNWRYAFLGEAILMFPFAGLGFVMKPLQLKGFAPAGSQKALTNIETVFPEAQGRMISSKKLIRLARKWQNVGRKRISSPRTEKEVGASCSNKSAVAEKGHFVVYTIDQRRYVIPLGYLSNNIFL